MFELPVAKQRHPAGVCPSQPPVPPSPSPSPLPVVTPRDCHAVLKYKQTSAAVPRNGGNENRRLRSLRVTQTGRLFGTAAGYVVTAKTKASQYLKRLKKLWRATLPSAQKKGKLTRVAGTKTYTRARQNVTPRGTPRHLRQGSTGRDAA